MSVRWPAGLEPANAPVFAHNEIVSTLPPARIWPVLIRAARWPDLYTNCKRLRFLNHEGPDLRPGTRFSWWTFGVPVETVIDGFEPERYLAWSGTGLGARGHHAWILEATADGGTRFVTEETQAGAVPWIFAPLLRAGLRHYHQRWLEGIERAARGG